MTLRTSINEMIKNKLQISTLTYSFSGKVLVIKIKSHISVQDMVKLVKEAAYNTFLDEIEYEYDQEGNEISKTVLGKGCIYAPYYKKLAFYKAILTHYTNLSQYIESADNLYLAITATDVMQRIFSKINTEQLSDIKQAIDELIEFRKLEILSQEKAQLNRLMLKMQEINSLLKEWDDPEIKETITQITGLFQRKKGT